MRTIIIRTFVVVAAVIIQASFLNLILPKNIILDLLPLLALAWVIISSFEKIWPWIVILGIFSDLITFERVGISVIFFISIAYGISFFSRRFLIERKLAGFIVTSLFVIIVFVILDLGRTTSLDSFSLIKIYENIGKLFLLKKILFHSFLNIVFFYTIYYVLNKIEKNIENHNNKIKVIS